jgi:hypothetical protein
MYTGKSVQKKREKKIFPQLKALKYFYSISSEFQVHIGSNPRSPHLLASDSDDVAKPGMAKLSLPPLVSGPFHMSWALLSPSKHLSSPSGNQPPHLRQPARKACKSHLPNTVP